MCIDHDKSSLITIPFMKDVIPSKRNIISQLIETWKVGGDPINLDCAKVANQNAAGRSF